MPTPRAALLLALGSVVALAAVGRPEILAWLLAFDGLAVAAVVLDYLRAPRPAALRAARRLREPLCAFAPNRIALHLENASDRPLRLEIADAPPATFDSRGEYIRRSEAASSLRSLGGHRRALTLPRRSSVVFEYDATPRRRGAQRFGELHVRARGPLGLAARQWRVPLSREVRVYPDLRGLAVLAAPDMPEPGQARGRGHREGREFAGLRPYTPGDDYRAIDWKATARRAAPIVREWQPERNQTIWLLLDCGRHLSARLPDGRTKLDHAVDAALALARAGARRGDQVGALLFGAEVGRIVPPGRGGSQLGPLAEALSAAEARVEESDYPAAFDALAERQRRRALVVVFTDLADPDTSALLVSRAALLRRRHLPLVAAVADSVVADTARAIPRTADEAYARLAAERILAERELAARRLAASGVRVESVPARELVAAVVGSYLEIKARGRL